MYSCGLAGSVGTVEQGLGGGNMAGFRCNDCGSLFQYPHRVDEDRGEYWGMPAFEPMYYCPDCGGDDFEQLQGDAE